MKCDPGFIPAYATNLPFVDDEMVQMWICQNSGRISAENRGTKDKRISKPAYGDNAIAWVQVMRTVDDKCTVKAKMTPEHNVHKTAYPLEVVIQERVKERDPEIISAVCSGCAASADGCKHQLALVMWLNRRCMEPSVTEMKCYWRSSTLSKVGRGINSMCSSQMGPQKKGKFESSLNYPDISQQEAEDFYLEVAQKIVTLNLNCQLAKYVKPLDPCELISIHNLTYDFYESGGGSAEDFFYFCSTKMNDEICSIIERLTQNQSLCPLWAKQRFGRITASKLYEATRCGKLDGSLVETILGAKIKDNKAMKRGRDLESKVKSKVEKMENVKFSNCGLILNKKLPVFGASPDGINDTHILEIKCPMSEKAMKTYIDPKTNKICANRLAQLHCQMHFAKKNFAIFCVASPQFETNGQVSMYHLRYDDQLFNEFIVKAKAFWVDAVFPKLKRSPM